MKIALAPVNQVVGDFRGNLLRLESALAEATAAGAALCVFPEMATCGCFAKDLLLQDRFVSDNLDVIDELADRTRGIGIVIGYVRWSPSGGGLENAAALLYDGEIVSTHVKTRLSYHGDADESRYFVSGDAVKPIEFDGIRFGITLSNDILGVAGPYYNPRGRLDPAAEAVQKGAEVILNLCAEPYRINGCKERLNALSKCAEAHHRPVLHVNMVGGSGEWVFDGAALSVDPYGALLQERSSFRESIIVVDVDSDADFDADFEETSPCDDAGAVASALTLGMRDFFQKRNESGAVVVLDGGLDSSLSAVIAVDALGPKQVRAVTFTLQEMDEDVIARTEAMTRFLGIEHSVMSADGWTDAFRSQVAALVNGGVVHRSDNLDLTDRIALRVLLLTAFGLNGDLLISSDTRTDLALSAPAPVIGDFALLKGVSKSLLFDIAARLRDWRAFPVSMLMPSAEERLCKIEVDGELGSVSYSVSYAEVDLVLDNYFQYGFAHPTLFSLGVDDALVRGILQKVTASEGYRRRLPPGINISGTHSPKIPIQHRFAYS